jgi:hypothetical protein
MKAPGALAALLMLLWTIGTGAGFAKAQSTLSDEERLERDFTDPLRTLPQVLVRDSYTSANYGPCTPQACVRNDETNQLVIRPVIPRIPANTLLPFTQLVRPTFTLGPCQAREVERGPSSVICRCSTSRFYRGQSEIELGS